MQFKCLAVLLSLLTSPCSGQDGSVEGDFNSNTGNNGSNVESNNVNETFQNTYNGAGSSPRVEQIVASCRAHLEYKFLFLGWRKAAWSKILSAIGARTRG